MVGDGPRPRWGWAHSKFPIARMVGLVNTVHHGGGGGSCEITGSVLRLRPLGAAVAVTTVLGEEASDPCQMGRR